jgi:nitrous oxidase accessory protein NosD
MTKTTRTFFSVAMVAACALLWAACAQRARVATVGMTIDRDDIAGVVTGASGSEAGVWVIAETSDLPTKFARIVVTDDRGRYVVPDLPQASYDVWVRGYGLVDSPRQRAKPGTTLNLEATPRPIRAPQQSTTRRGIGTR